ncbi:hypothetical protein [Streptosporangium sp. NPDC000239]|uniref:hypothetical protein n=1 Tax=unclassified Streptosporangium TaxID=2632669 RepID=UPI00332B7027
MSNGSRKTRGILAGAVLSTALVGGLAAGFGLPAAASASVVDSLVPCLLQAPGTAPTVCEGTNDFLDAQRTTVANGLAAGKAPLRVTDKVIAPQAANALSFAKNLFGLVNEVVAAEGIMDPKYSNFAKNATESARTQSVSVAEGNLSDPPAYGVSVGETRKNVNAGRPQSAPVPPETHGRSDNPYELTPLPRPASAREIGDERPSAEPEQYVQPPATRPAAPKPAPKPQLLSPLGTLLPLLGLGGLG